MSRARSLADLSNENLLTALLATTRIGIGTTDPSATLEVSGDARVTGILTVGSSSLTFDDAGHFTATGDLIDNSDIKLKTNIQPLENSLEKVNQLRGVSYDSVDIEKDNCIGVIAQEVEEVYPEFVSEGEEGIKGVDYSKMVAVLIEAVKELTEEVNTLKSELNK